MNRQQGTKRSREYQDDLQDVPCNDQSRPILEFNQCMIGIELPAQQEARRQQTLLSSSRNKKLNATTREMITTRRIVTMSTTVTNNCPADNRRIKRRFSKVGDMFRNNSLNCSPSYHSPWDISIPSSSRSPYSNHSLRMMIEETLNEHQEPVQIEHSHTTSRRRRGKKVQRRFSPINREKMDKFGIKCSSISENQVWSMMSSSSSDSLFFKEGEEARRESTTMNHSDVALIADSSSSFSSSVVSLSSSLSSSSKGVDDLTHSLDEVVNF